jgi:hypothetical protein
MNTSILHMNRPRNGFLTGSSLRYLAGRITTGYPQASPNPRTGASYPVLRSRLSIRELKLAAVT